MSKVEFNLKLFITCRLCLEESGTYQILPGVQELIKYCFDITVDPFDALPQLICTKCDSILSDYAKTKELFVQKQVELKKKIQENNILQKEIVNNGLFEEGINDTVKNIKRTTISSSSTDLQCKTNIYNNQINHTLPKIVEKKLPVNQEWEKSYRKTYQCRLCNSSWFVRKSMISHKARHIVLKRKHSDVFRKYCTVTLPKIDSKPNLTGSMDKLVYSQEKIISKGCIDFFIAYTKNTSNISSSEDEDIKPVKGSKFYESSDSSSEPVVVRRKRRKRISSRSSNDTVVLEDNTLTMMNISEPDESEKKSQIGDDCISIDDTDSDDDKAKILNEEKPLENEKVKAKALQELISATTNRFVKRYETTPKHTQTYGQQLKRKFLSLGRKIINRPGFNCSGIVKFLENVNLDIIWLSRSPLNVTGSSNYLKIIARMKNTHEKVIKDFEGYTKKYVKRKAMSPLRKAILEESKSSVKNLNTVKRIHVDAKSLAATVSQDHKYSSQDTDAEYAAACKTELKPDIQGVSVSTELDAAMLYTINPADKHILLNANPVANPKQLPKKFNSTEVKSKTKYPTNILSLDNFVNSEICEDDASMQMPIITSTTSLALPQVEIPSTNNSNTSNHSMGSPSNVTQKPAIPRIKVKSVAQLMSKDALNRMNEPVVNENQNQSVMLQTSVYAGPQGTTLPSASQQVVAADFVMLDTVELPNTKTYSPFLYFKSLLAVHNITLLDTETTLSGEFHTLIKFKVLYNQGTKDHVVLCLSLSCANNVFCLKVKDRNDENINMTKISANWQWEILKIYKGDVVPKLLLNAQKISQEVYDYTNSFLCLLKSINFITK